MSNPLTARYNNLHDNHNSNPNSNYDPRALDAQPTGRRDDDESTKRSFERLTSDEFVMSDSSAANQAHYSSNSSILHKRPRSERALSDSDTNLDQRIPAARSPSRRSPLQKSVHRKALRDRRKRSSNIANRSIARRTGESGMEKIAWDDAALARDSAGSADDLGGHDHLLQPEPRTTIANSDAPPAGSSSALLPTHTRTYDPRSHAFRPRLPPGFLGSASGLLLQPETHPISEEQLIVEVRGIYSGLGLVEKKCIEIDKQQSESGSPLTDMQWQALTALHRTLLHEHHDFFLASQHPSASPVLKRLAEKYAMPARMWRYGIHSYLELLRQRLPQSLEHMLTFIYLAYSMITMLLESVQAFAETWIECLGDLARYRMAVEEYNIHDREVWAGVARYWYNKVADRSPHVGRIQHHLAVLARPDIIQQLFYYTKSLVSVVPFPNTRESILLLFNPLSDGLKAKRDYYEYPIPSIFVCAHGSLFTKGCTDEFVMLANCFLSQFDNYIRQVGPVFRMQGVCIMSSNLAAIFEYGHKDAVLPAQFHLQDAHKISLREVYVSAIKDWDSHPATINNFSDSETPHLQTISYASRFAFLSLSIILARMGEKNVFPAFHISLAFIWCLVLNGSNSMKYIEAAVPWKNIADFLNSILQEYPEMGTNIECDGFPICNEAPVHRLPEDYMIRGQAWSRFYFPTNFFETCAPEDDERSIEFPSLTLTRANRCLWLGARIATFKRWIRYDHSAKRFSTTPFSLKFQKFAERHNPFEIKQHTAPSTSHAKPHGT